MGPRSNTVTVHHKTPKKPALVSSIIYENCFSTSKVQTAKQTQQGDT